MFRPKFIVSASIAETADLINKPHEDYPRRVPMTERLIDGLIGHTAINHELRVTSFWAKSIHSQVMWDLPVDRGAWRTCNVQVGNDHPPAHYKVEEMINDIFPVRRGWTNAWGWYKDFQEIHPFRDGNGRVGGIILAWLTYDFESGLMLAPCQ